MRKKKETVILELSLRKELCNGKISNLNYLWVELLLWVEQLQMYQVILAVAFEEDIFRTDGEMTFSTI